MAGEKLRRMVFDIGYSIKDKPIRDANAAVDEYKDTVVGTNVETDKLARKTDQVGREMQETGAKGKRAAGTIGTAFKGLGATLGVFFGFYQIKRGFDATLRLAGTLEEETAKFETVFGGVGRAAGQLADEASIWVNRYSDRVGRGRLETMRFISESQNLLVGFGATRKEAFNLSTQIQELGVDLASFSNIADADALNLLQSGLLGNHRATKSLGIALTESTLKAKAAALGYQENFDKLDPLTKMQIRLAVAIDQSTDAIGDAERTSGSYTNQMRRMRGMFEDTVAEVGQNLIPHMTELIKTINENKEGIIDFITIGVNTATVAVDLFSKGIGFVTKNSKILIPVLGGLLTIYGGFKIVGVITGLYYAFAAATVAATGSTVAAIGPMAAFNAVLTANPIGLVITAIGALVAAGIYLVQNWEQIWRKMREIWDWFSNNEPDVITTDSGFNRTVVGRTKRSDREIAGRQTTESVARARAQRPIGNTQKHENAGSRRPGGKFATGTNSASRGLALVGEQGPEIVDFGGGETVYSNNQSGQLFNQQPAEIVISLNVQGTGVTDETLQIISEVTRDTIDDYYSEMATKGGFKLGNTG